MPNKMERFTVRARRVLSLAQEDAERLKHNYIGSEHLLLGLMREEGGAAGKVLHDLGLDTHHIEEMVERLTRAGGREPNARLDLSPDAKKVLELAVDEARRIGHHYIGTEHLLLGLVRQSQGVAMDILKRLNVSPEEVRRGIRRKLAEAPVQPVNPGESPVLAGAMANLLVRLPRGGASVADLMALLTPIFGFAQDEAAKSQQNLNRWYVLLALMRQDSVVGFVLRDMGLKEAPIEALAKDESSRNPPPGIEASAQFGNVIEFIVKELWPRQNGLLGSQYLVLGLLHFHEDMFKQLGLGPEEIRARIERLW